MKLFIVTLIVFNLFYVCVSQTITRGPYLQSTSKASTYICYNTDSLTFTKISYGLTKQNLNSVFLNTTDTTTHFALITNLQANTKYYYTINITNAINCLDTFYFITNPENNTLQKMRFMALGDCGSGYQSQYNLKKAIGYYNKKHLNGILLLGDNAYENGLESEYQTNFFNPFKTNFYFPNSCIYPSPGNHDYANDYNLTLTHQIPYYTIFKTPQLGELGGLASNHKEFYSYNYGNIHFVSLDSYGIELNTFHIWDTLGPQYTWLQQDLQQDNSLWKIVYFHHPPFTMGSHNSDSETELVLIRERLSKLLEKYGVDLVINGHSHTYERSWLQKGHYGLETSFNKTLHVVDSSSATYDGSQNSCPYVKDTLTNNGTVYIVAGEAGKIGSVQSSYPHNSKYFSDASKTGALFFEIENNRLDAFYLEEDSLIHDSFTMFKNVNNKINLTSLGSQTLTASWPGTYNWQHSTAYTQSVLVNNTATSLNYIVTDSLNCIADTFNNVLASIASLNATKKNVIVYPNPTNGKLVIDASFFNSELYLIEIINTTGQSVFKVSSSKEVLTINIQHLKDGEYFITLKNSEKTITKPFILKR